MYKTKPKPTIGWEYVKTYLALVKWAGQMFAIPVYDAAERLCQVLSSWSVFGLQFHVYGPG